MTNKKKRKKEK